MPAKSSDTTFQISFTILGESYKLRIERKDEFICREAVKLIEDYFNKYASQYNNIQNPLRLWQMVCFHIAVDSLQNKNQNEKLISFLSNIDTKLIDSISE